LPLKLEKGWQLSVQNNYNFVRKNVTSCQRFKGPYLTNSHLFQPVEHRLFHNVAGMPDVELGVNDMWRQGKEVVGRHDIIPVITEEWIRLENVEFHSCVQQDEYERTRVIK
jgi:hypothetical protein